MRCTCENAIRETRAETLREVVAWHKAAADCFARDYAAGGGVEGAYYGSLPPPLASFAAKRMVHQRSAERFEAQIPPQRPQEPAGRQIGDSQPSTAATTSPAPGDARYCTGDPVGIAPGDARYWLSDEGERNL